VGDEIAADAEVVTAVSVTGAAEPPCNVAMKIRTAARTKIAPKRTSPHGLDGGGFSGSGGSVAMKENRNEQGPHK
jgi:hypothetical protein